MVLAFQIVNLIVLEKNVVQMVVRVAVENVEPLKFVREEYVFQMGKQLLVTLDLQQEILV